MQRIVRRGSTSTVRFRRAMMLLAGTVPSLAALQSIRAARPDGAPIYVILDNLSAHKGSKIRRWARTNKVELCFTLTSWPPSAANEPASAARRASAGVDAPSRQQPARLPQDQMSPRTRACRCSSCHPSACSRALRMVPSRE